VAPSLPYGNSRQNIGFAGTLTIRPRVLIDVIKDICHSLVRHEFDTVVVVNGHGGNVGCISVALEEFHYETKAVAVSVRCWELASDTPPPDSPAFEGHAGRVETALMLALAKDDVDTDAYSLGSPTVELGEFGGIAPAQYAPFDGPITFMVSTWESSYDGHYGDPSAATAAAGGALVDAWVDRLGALLTALKRGDLKMTTRTEPVPSH
jgi:creatinine amidohydrolase